MRFIVPIQGSDARKKLEDAKKKGADLVEIHIDKVDDKKLVENCELQTVVVMRPDWAGGDYTGYEKDRLKSLKEYSEIADFVEVDMEIASQYKTDIIDYLEKVNTVSVVSKYFEKLPEVKDIIEIMEECRKIGAVARIFVPINSHDDVYKVLKALEKENDSDEGVTIAVDAYGSDEKLFRYLSYHFGSYWTRAEPDEINDIRSLKIGPLSKKLINEVDKRISK
ncbi:type I 3-dehydroquinate dehydratase [Candidatus Undinarchaeota archaeon]